MATQPCAVVGIGQTKHKKRRDDVSLPGLVREAAQRALDDAEHDAGPTSTPSCSARRPTRSRA